ncbi:MAG: ATP-binding cassette domain-containing protein [Ruminococcaceae bacterium]|nr:ATP-binding cassette domain-containing protein [Oscillospiraceae bacterium]
MTKDTGVLLEMKNIVKEFPGVRALDGVSLTLRRGSVHALMGENGAGKSTLMKCLFGIYSADSGEVYLEGREVSFKNPNDALRNGVAMVHQELNQATKRNVMDNIWLGRYPTRLGFITSEREMYERTKRIFDDLGIKTDPRRIMSTMSVAERQMAEIAKAVSYDAKVIVLDEPTSSLSDREVEHLFRIIETLKQRGCGIIYISHKMDEILRISDEITVMRDGSHIATEPSDNMTMDKIIHLMVGRELTEMYPKKTNTPGKVILKVEGLSSKHNHVKDVSFDLRQGEIIGFAGLAGAGRTEVIENIFGISERESGRIYLGGKEIKNRDPREAIRNGFALITEERRATGIFGILDICENTTVSGLKKYLRFGLLSDKKRREDTDWAIRSMNIKTASQKTQIKLLSGGNQQKVIIGRWLLTEPEILMLDEPTRGIDVGAKYEIYQLIDALAAKGKSIIVISSELPELLGICDRIYVMSSGRIAGEVDAKKTTQEEIMTLASKYM